MQDIQSTSNARSISAAGAGFAAMSARRLLALGGIGLILVGMLVGDLFAVFVLHQNAAKVGESLSGAAHAAVSADANAVARSFKAVGILLAGGLALVLLGFFHGAYYAGADLYRHEALDYALLSEMSIAATAKNAAVVDAALGEYGQLAGEKAVHIAAHAHSIEFGLLAI